VNCFVNASFFFQAFTSTVLSPLTYIIEEVFGSLGRSLQNFFQVIPAHLQVLIWVTITFLLVIMIIMSCMYKLLSPLISCYCECYLQTCRGPGNEKS